MAQMTLEQALQVAVQRHQQGQLKDAESIYRQVLQHAPEHPIALHLLGVLVGSRGQLDEAIGLIQRAIRTFPGDPAFHNNLGNLLKEKGDCTGAAEAYRKALQLKPDYAMAHNNLGAALQVLGRLEEAAACVREAIRLQPGFGGAHLNLGRALRGSGQWQEAEVALREATRLMPGEGEAWLELAGVLQRSGKTMEAIEACGRAVKAQPKKAEASTLMAMLMEETGNLEGAAEWYGKALSAGMAGQEADVQYNLGVVLGKLGREEEAERAYRRAVELRPDFPLAVNNLGTICKARGKMDEAQQLFRKALQQDERHAEASANLALVLALTGQHGEARQWFERSLELRPEQVEAHSTMLFSMLFAPEVTAEQLYAAHAQWNARHAERFREAATPHENQRTTGRRLKVGYVSPNFSEHVVGMNMWPLVREHDRSEVEVFCYHNSRGRDRMTDRFQRSADGWREIGGMRDDAVAELIRSDAIDVLVDLALHMEGSRLLMFARKPAPVQVTFAGYPGSTGLWAMDYRLTDPHLDPDLRGKGMWYSEESAGLESFWCYEGRETAPSELPAESSGVVTFGCLNNFLKVNEGVLRTWGKVLKGVAGSRMKILCTEGAHRAWALEILAQEGVELERVAFAAPRSRAQYFELYRDIDIGLDTWPYNGHTTSLDSLWMGVPVVTLEGSRVVGRAGVSQWKNLGAEGWIARDEGEFVAIATRWAGDVPGLRKVRSELRSRMEGSVLMNAKRFARGIERAYREMWSHWCAR